ncbi:MAG TPA: UbiD family decarboxylase [Dehalococcoidia bacterium]|nr:UbiD family decarboxylase [Dehalococcoidia bacterium]
MDLRGFLEKLREDGQLASIQSEVDWNLQAGALCSMSNRIGGPAMQFTRVKDYPGLTLAGSLFTGPGNIPERREKPWTRHALALDLDGGTGYEEFMGELLQRTSAPLHPTVVSTGACKDNVLAGKDADILKFPIPFLHEGDGGRYGTCGVVIVKDPDSTWQSWGFHRWMVLDGQRLTGPFPPWDGLGIIHQKNESRGQATPFAIALGGDPATVLAAAMVAPPGTDKAALAGGLRQDPIPLVRAETSDLLVPAEAEMIIEGEVRPGERAEEGPFPQWIGRTPKTSQPVYHIKAITYRHNPILPIAAEGSKISDSLALTSTTLSLALTQGCGAVGLPIRWVNCPVETMMALCVVSLRKFYDGQPSRAAKFLFALPFAQPWFDKVLVLDDDVEAIDWERIMTDWWQKPNPSKDYHFLAAGNPTMLSAYSNSPAKTDVPATKVWIDATWPKTWEKTWIPRRVGFESYPEALQQRVVERWKELGLPGETVVKKSV